MKKQGAPEPIAALKRVRIRESNESLVDIRKHCPQIGVSPATVPYLRRTVADMLNTAQHALPIGIHLQVGTALRTLIMQKDLWDGYFHTMMKEHPQWPSSALRRATNRFFAPYDQSAPPGHCTGGAVDTRLVNEDGEMLDMTSPTIGWEAAYTWSDKLSDQARHNRMLMVNAMLNAGFSNCREEFWHYSWGDSAWAVRTGRRDCFYGRVDPPQIVEGDPIFGTDLPVQSDIYHHWEIAWNIAYTDGHQKEWCILIRWCRGSEVSLQMQPEAFHRKGTTAYLGDGQQWYPLHAVKVHEMHLLHLCPVKDQLTLASAPLFIHNFRDRLFRPLMYRPHIKIFERVLWRTGESVRLASFEPPTPSDKIRPLTLFFQYEPRNAGVGGGILLEEMSNRLVEENPEVKLLRERAWIAVMPDIARGSENADTLRIRELVFNDWLTGLTPELRDCRLNFRLIELGNDKLKLITYPNSKADRDSTFPFDRLSALLPTTLKQHGVGPFLIHQKGGHRNHSAQLELVFQYKSLLMDGMDGVRSGMTRLADALIAALSRAVQ